MKRLLYILMIWLCHLSAFAQTDGYNPSNPPNPSVPDKDTTTYYHLSVVSMPEGIGSFNTMGGDYAAGTSIYLYAYNHDYCEFKRWRDEDGNTLSTNYRLYYTMPAKDVKVVAEYDYNPSNPANPDVIEKVRQYTLILKSKPAAGGTFSPNGSVTINGGDSRWVYAYANTGFYFQHWEDEDGQVLSTDGSYNLKMPLRNTTLYGVFKYDPASPDNPGKNAWDEFLGQVVVDDFTPGNLSSAISNTIGGSSNASKVSQIIVAGKINQYDFSIANNYSNCTMVDFSRTTGATVVPSYCYSGNTKLNQILLPASIKEIQYAAFNNCSDLTELTCLAVTPPSVGSNAFAGVAAGMVVRVPEASIELYEASEAWNKFDILPILANVHSLELNLPAECSDGRYKNMSLELVNIKSGQKYKYVVTDRLNYIFSNLMKNTTYNAYLKNLSGVVLAEIDSIKIDETDISLTFSNMLTLQNVKLNVLTPDDADVTSQVGIRWFDANDKLLSYNHVVEGQVEGYPVRYTITLPQSFAMQYRLPADSVYMVNASNNNITCRLEVLPQMTLQGRVVDMASSEAMQGAVVTVSQKLNGMYSKTFTTYTDDFGAYIVDVFAAPTTVTYSFTDYVSQTVELHDSLIHTGVVALDKTTLKSITGARIGLQFTYTNSVVEGAQAETQNWYSDYSNIEYSLYNKTQQKAITQFNVQYPTIVLLEEVEDNDLLEVTAVSKNLAFMPAVAEVKVKDLQGIALIPIVQLGGVNLSFKSTENAGVVAMMYDHSGNLVKKSSFAGSALSLRNLPDGDYTFVVMGESEFFNSFYNLNGFGEAGLVENTDYVKKTLTVKSGVIAALNLTLVPFFDESKLYYTGSNTSFVVNKTKVVAGNYLTLQAKVDFKEVYRNAVSNVELLFDIPQGNSFVANSMMVGSSQYNYQQEANQVTVALGDNYQSRVRFCIIPTESGDFSPNAYVRFVLDGKTVTQPIGSADFMVESINISVPSMVSKATFSASGTAIGNSVVEIFDGNTLVGQTKSLANGMWVAECQLANPQNLSTHAIMARVTTKDGLVMNTETQQMTYDENAIELSKVRMYHWNPEMNTNYEVVFDFQHPSTVAQKYTYYIYNRQFTFTIDFTDNDTTKISNVKLRVKTGNGMWTTLPTTFDKKKNRWVANGEFGNMYDGNVPKNVAVAYDMKTPYVLDAATVAEGLNLAKDMKDYLQASLDKGQDMIDQLVEAYTDENYNEQLVKELEEKVFSVYGLTEVEPEIIQNEEQAKAFVADIEEALSDSIFHIADYMIETEIEELYKTADYAENINIGTCEGLVEADMVANGYTKIELNDSTGLYYRVTEEKLTLVNFVNNYRAEISLTGDSPVASLIAKAVASDDFITKVDAFIAEAQRQCNEINEKLDKVKNSIDTFKNIAGYAYAKAKEKFSKALSTLKQFAASRRAGEVIPGQALIEGELKQTAKSSGKVMLNAQTVGNKLSNAMKSPLGVAAQKLVAAFDIVNQILNGISDLKRIVAVYRAVPVPCPANEPGATEIRDLSVYYGTGAVAFYSLNIAADIIAINSAVASAASLAPTGGVSALVLVGDLGLMIAKGWACNEYAKKMSGYITELKVMLSKLKCKETDKDGEYAIVDEIHWIYSDEPDADVSIDPSGFVYEGVESNRLQGVTATCYYKEMVEDMYGDMHENIVLWDAEEYAQKNPLFTDEMGMYRWDVPEGLWQVKFEKEGYQTTYSEWLPVPPPQLEVNIAMVQNAQPEVTGAKAYEDGVEINFSKYMKPATLTADNLYLKLKSVGNEQLLKDVTIELLDGESVSEDDATNYASKVAIRTTEDLGLANEVYVIVSGTVESYAGIAMGETYSQKLDVVKKVREIKVDETLNVGYEQQETLLVGVLPGDASKGKTLVVTSGSDMIASVDGQGTQRVTLDENGQASIQVSGELYGSTALTFSVEDADVTAQTMVNVVDPAKLQPVKDALASRISGTQVYRGQTVTLSCETEGATIYYTTDGSCPCDEASRIKYEGKPIAINGDMVIKAMAVGINGSESEVKEYSYSIKTTSMKLNLSEGWNWISHNQDADIAVADLQQDYVNRILSQEGELYNDPKLGFVGRMDDFQATQSIKVQTKQQATYALSGEQFNPSAKTIDLVAGWNWMGYPVEQVMALDEALAYLDAEEGDCLASIEGGFAEYANGSWTGTLTTMTPGQGYLYKSASPKSFIYRDDIVSKAKALNAPRLETQVAPWTVNVHAHSNMMCLTAELIDNGSKAADDAYFVAAFAGEECRGLGKFVNGRLYLAVYGNKANETIRFRAVNRENGDEWGISETLSFTADKVGSWLAPVQLNLGEPTGIHEVTASGWQGKAIYNLMGIRVNSLDQEGVYIINGIKVMINKQNVNQYVQ